mmetsp:Transcript_17840/g.43659  ORF Transcript_17840/g.43659 Transcript_17840/m.43659 type:complete len:91 (+) Transcript_17840:97-369(+)
MGVLWCEGGEYRNMKVCRALVNAPAGSRFYAHKRQSNNKLQTQAEQLQIANSNLDGESKRFKNRINIHCIQEMHRELFVFSVSFIGFGSR